MSLALVLFYILAFISVASAIMVIVSPNPVRSALFLVLALFVQAIFYLTLSAQFIAAVQIIVYSGAIMVLFLFVIMLLNLGAPDALKETGYLQKSAAVALAAVMFLMIGASRVLSNAGLGPVKANAEFLNNGGTVEQIGRTLYNPMYPWLFPFEVTSFLLLVGVVGAVVLAKRRI